MDLNFEVDEKQLLMHQKAMLRTLYSMENLEKHKDVYVEKYVFLNSLIVLC